MLLSSLKFTFNQFSSICSLHTIDTFSYTIESLNSQSASAVLKFKQLKMFTIDGFVFRHILLQKSTRNVCVYVTHT